jgi:hypothetical protein
MVPYTRLLSTDVEQNTFVRLVVQRAGSMPEMKEFRQRLYDPVWLPTDEAAWVKTRRPT